MPATAHCACRPAPIHQPALTFCCLQVLQNFLDAHKAASDLTHVNILAELLLTAGRYTEAHTLILGLEQEQQDADLPIDLQARTLSCTAQLRQFACVGNTAFACQAAGYLYTWQFRAWRLAKV